MTHDFHPRTPVDSHHPGPPRFVHVGEPLRDPIFVLGADTTGTGVEVAAGPTDRDGLAPRVPEPRRTPEPYARDDFEWDVVSTPAGSDGDVLSFATSTTLPRYDHGLDHVAEFEADVPGEYVLALDAPDGVHELTVFAFPERETTGSRPRLELDGRFDSSTEQFHVESNAALAPESGVAIEAPVVVFLADDRDPLADDSIETAADGRSATVSLDALDGERGRIHAAAYDGRCASVQDVLELSPDGAVERPNRPPEWLRDAVLYQIFPRSWAGTRGETTFETLIEGDESTGARGVEYLSRLGVDVVWLTPVVPAVSPTREYPPGGPHGYGTTDYFDIAPDLVPPGTDPLDAYGEFVEACHERGIRVVFDLVVSHAGLGIDEFASSIAWSTGTIPDDGDLDGFRILQWNEDARTFDWWDRADVPRLAPDGTTLEAAPRSTGFAGSRWMPNWNYDNVALREYVLTVADFWSREVGVDGFRCDIAFGVQHGFWKELRELVRANDGEFVLLDEAIPNDPAFSASEFDVHCDTTGFTDAARDVARSRSVGTDDNGGETAFEAARRSHLDSTDSPHPQDLVEAVLDRREQGHPDYSLLLNSIENHDEHRLLNAAAVDPLDPDHDDLTESAWERAAALQRACFAAAVTLPGIPTVYYGAERAISRYGTGRVDEGDDADDRGLKPSGDVDPAADVRPGGRQRAFMNWNDYDEDHLAFYERLIGRYHDLDALHTDAGIEPLDRPTDAAATLFVRDASDPDDADPERVLVVLNFEAEPILVDLPDSVDATNLLAGVDATNPLGGDGERDGHGSTAAVGTVGVFEVEGSLDETPAVRRASKER
ncbi:alpha-amylase family glycosyl hydrolase [Halobellus rarus]|uniref:Alpha-amylase family glycosyl hydrolase n=1 Tax=Halobellus rarus TaxID=1126237 RepID=A0ABD6CUC3_9EURY|nr:alpha-amylase family glycosyl hydrolase [Halobellus rarus]